MGGANNMGRGLGDAQKNVIAAGRATATIWEFTDRLPLRVGSLEPWPAEWAHVPDVECSESRDGKDRWRGELTVRSADELRSVLAWADYAYLSKEFDYPAGSEVAMWDSTDIVVRLHPGLFDIDYRIIDSGQCVIPGDIKRRKASATASTSRALTTLCKRGLAVGWGKYFNGERALAAGEARDWRRSYREERIPWRSLYPYLVTDRAAIVSVSEVTPCHSTNG